MLLASAAHCAHCDMAPLCHDESHTRLSKGPCLQTGERLVWEHDPLRALYVVKRGAIKAYSTDAEGQERVRGFCLPGELVGVDALAAGRHRATIEALTETEFCALPVASLQQSVSRANPLNWHVLELASRDLDRARTMAGEYNAEQRLAAFLLDLSDRMVTHTGNRTHLELAMSRRDIANYLRLVMETVSRVLSRFRDDGIVNVRRRAIDIRDRDRLETLAMPLYVAPSVREAPAVAAA